MRIGTVDGRAVLVSEHGYEDIEKTSSGAFPSDIIGVLERWEDFRDWEASSDRSWSAVQHDRLGPPVPHPRQVFALAANYRDHAAEAGLTELPENPIVFTKFPTCITGPYDDVLLSSNRADWEVELVVVMGRYAKDVSAEDAWSYVAGVTVGQDVSDRRVQFRKPGPHLAMSKSFPTYGPTGPWLVTLDELTQPYALGIRCMINGETMQDSNTDQLIFSVPELIASMSAMVPLLPGDLIFTGTPAGVGSTRDPRRYLAPGDVITSEIDGIGQIRNTCVEKD